MKNMNCEVETKIVKSKVGTMKQKYDAEVNTLGCEV